ncbi:MAG: hypothetical protein E7643_09485 [Ruminococcaceae bacterium]|nr:hypothetical protein [Oscillospiraceae bacterium]
MEFLMWLAVAGLITLYTVQSLFTKLYTDHYPGDPSMASSVLTVVSGLSVVVITFFCFAFCQFTPNLLSILIGTLNAVVLFGYNHFLVKASGSGPYSIVMTFNLSGGILIPVIASLVMGWDSSWATEFQIVLNTVCIVAIISSVYLVSQKKEATEEKQGISLRFLLSCFGLGICNGVYGTFLTLQQQTAAAGGEGNRDEMVIVTFLVAALLAFFTGLIRTKGRILPHFRQTKASLFFLIATSVVFALAVNVIVMIIPYFDTTILYTLDNSSVLIMSVLISAIFFHEKLSAKNILGIALMCAALVAMNLLPALFL